MHIEAPPRPFGMGDAAARGMRTLRQRLRAESFPDAQQTSVIETHVSWVFLTEREAFKIKKPVQLGFLDFSTIERRKAACDAELRLNRRLALDVYRGVEAVREHDGVVTVGGAEGRIIDWAVRMRRLDESTRADVLAARGQLGKREIDALARRIAEFHRSARARPDLGAGHVAAEVEENFGQTRATIGRYLRPEEIGELVTWQRAFMAQNGTLFDERARDGYVRDGHGDLRLEHVYFDEDGIRVIDCIEFDERYRMGDVASDVAFLSMDLAFAGRTDLAERFLATYASETGDYGLYDVVDFYESYRAFVRGKVSAMLASDATAPADIRAQAEHLGRRYFVLALSAGHRPLLEPSVTAVGGLIGTGKSTLADALADDLGAAVVCADRTRKQMLGVPALQRIDPGTFEGAYHPAFTGRVYQEVLQRAEHVLASRRPVVIDASFRSRSMRDDVRLLSARHGAPFCFVECRAADSVVRERLRGREKGSEVSDARVSLLDDFAARFEPVCELATDEHVIIDTTGPLDDTVRQVEKRIPSWPPQLTG